MALDPTDWAIRPRSQLALNAAIDCANKGDTRFDVILLQLKRDGVTSGAKLLKRWDGKDWVSA